MIVICVKINTDFKHHLKLQIGNKYFAEIYRDNIIENSYSIYDLNSSPTNRNFIGRYNVDQFMTLRDYNLNKLLE